MIFSCANLGDCQINQRLGCRLLEKLGYEVSTANDGQQAIDAIRQTEFVCCLMDCQMPGKIGLPLGVAFLPLTRLPVLDGFQATKRLRELEQNGGLPGRLPIIALTANVTQESEDECRAAGMDHFLPKPLKMNGKLLWKRLSKTFNTNASVNTLDLDDILRRLRRPLNNSHH